LKSLLQRWFSPGPHLGPQQAARLSVWRALPATGHGKTFGHTRCVVVDVETTSLSLMTDTLISMVLQQHSISRKENILVHGISGSVQLEGMPPADSLLSFLEYLGKDPLVAFHVTFDETMIRRAMLQYLGFSFKHPWLDLAYVMPALYSNLMYSHRSLDDWASHFNIRNEDRHNALADALVTAQLLQVATSAARRGGDPSYNGLRSLERTYRYTSGKG